MSDDNGQPQEQPAQNVPPICAHCLHDPLEFKVIQLNIGVGMFALFFCTNCRKPFPATFTGVQQPRVMPASIDARKLIVPS